MIRKAFKFRVYPTTEQATNLAVQFGCARFVYNHYRRVREEFYQETGTGLNYNDCATDLVQFLKVDFPWLKDANAQVLQQALRNLDTAYVNFFEGRADYPNLKRKHDSQSVRFPQDFKLKGGSVYLTKVGWVKVVQHRRIEGKMKNATVSKTKTGKYFVSIQCEVEQTTPEPRPESVGIDLGIATFASLSSGEKIVKPKHLHMAERRIKIRQRRVSRKVKGSNGRNAARLCLSATYEKVANKRNDFHHKLSRHLVDNFGVIAFESLNVSGMVKNHNLAKAISDCGWSQFVNMVEYKAKWEGAQVLRVDRFFPSSKLCSDCGEKHKHLTLNIRHWVCLSCGVLHDRDENAAINILKQATRGARESYAGGDTSDEIGRSAPEKFQGLSLEAHAL